MVTDKTIDWERIVQQYGQMVKYATALKLWTGEAEQILRRSTRGGPKHPTYRAIEEVGKAVKSVFIAVADEFSSPLSVSFSPPSPDSFPDCLSETALPQVVFSLSISEVICTDQTSFAHPR